MNGMTRRQVPAGLAAAPLAMLRNYNFGATELQRAGALALREIAQGLNAAPHELR
jgi:hypothetical protein